MEKIVNLFESKNLTLASAESLTGGLFANSITNIPGASKIYKGGIVSYSNEIKHELLEVSNEILETHGAISYECAKAMCENVKLLFNSDISISFTGNAGPSESEEKPVGLVFIGISYKEKTEIFKLNLSGDRLKIKNECILFAKEKICDIIFKEF